MASIGKSLGDWLTPKPAAVRASRSRDPGLVRLWAALLEAEGRLSALKAKRGAGDAVVKACEIHYENAKQQISVFVAWDCLHLFDDAYLEAMDPAERSVHWLSLAAEAGAKLKGWRAQAAGVLIKGVDAKAAPSLVILRELEKQVATEAQNMQHKIEIFEKRTLPSLIVFLGLVDLGFALFYHRTMNDPAASKVLLDWAHILMLGMLAGGLGGILSMTFSLGQVDLSKKIPDMRLSALVTSIRPLLGATVGIPVAVLVSQGYFQIKGLDPQDAVLAFCFVAGFSERWFLGQMEKLQTSTVKK